MKTLTRSILLAGLALTVSACCGAAASTRDFYRITAYTTDGEVLTVSAMASPLGLNTPPPWPGERVVLPTTA